MPSTRYARSGDVNIAYRVVGDGVRRVPAVAWLTAGNLASFTLVGAARGQTFLWIYLPAMAACIAVMPGGRVQHALVCNTGNPPGCLTSRIAEPLHGSRCIRGYAQQESES